MSGEPSVRGMLVRERVFLAVRWIVGAGCVYQAAFTFHVGIADRIPLVPQALLAAALLSGFLARWALLVVGLVVAGANLAPFLDIPVYPWFTLSHPLGNAVIFAFCGVGWLSSLKDNKPPIEGDV